MRTQLLAAFLVVITACSGDDGVHHLADAPSLPDAPADASIDTLDPDVTLSATIAGTGTGTVSSSPDGITCSSGTCSADFDPGAVVTLTAIADASSVFAGWSGACTGTTPTCEVTLAQSASVTATFTLAQYAVTVTKAGAGMGTVTGSGINCGTTCTMMVDHGTMLSLTATPANLSVFAGWGGACSGTASCTVTVTGPTAISASFPLDTPTLFVSKGGNGDGTVTATGINCGADCDETYTAGQLVTLTAAASTGSTFTGWAGGGCSGTGTCTVTVTAATTVTATFTLQSFALTVVRTGSGAGNVASTPAGIACGADCTESYAYGTTVTLTATPSIGSTFTGWSGACSGTAMCVVSITQARSVTATFGLQQFTLTASVTGNGTITSSPAGITCGADCSEGFGFGTVVTLTAAAGTGSSFAGWGGACTGTGACTVTIDAAKSVTAAFTLMQFPLTVALTGAGTGTVTSSPAGISCGADCTESYDYNQLVTLTAAPALGSTFAGWSGGGCTGTGSCTVTVTAATTVTATFGLQTFLLTAARAGNGTGTVTSTPAGISCGGDCSEAYSYNQTVTLGAAAATGSTFTGWSGGGCTGTGACSVTVTAATTVTATFTLMQFPLTVTRAGAGTGTVTSSPAGITCPTDCMENIDYGTSVTLTAAPATGSTFTGWSGGGCTGTGPCTVTVSTATSVTATFGLQTFTLTAARSGNGSGTITSTPAGISCPGDCSELYTYNTPVTLTAAPATGSTFTGWSGACTGTGTCTVMMTQARSVTATFTLMQFPLMVTRTGGGTGTVTSSPAGITCPADCMENFDYGTVVTLTATPSMPSSTFTGWSGACTGTGTCTVTVTAATSVTATFGIATFALDVTIAGTGGGMVTSSPAGITCGTDCNESFNYNTPVTLTPMPNATSDFAGWSGACTGTGACVVSMTQARSVTATFNLKTFTLTVTKSGDGSGLVTGNGVNCGSGSMCQVTLTIGTPVTLMATPGSNPATLSTFAGWSGGCSGSGNCVFTLTTDTTVDAGFKLKPNLMFTTSAAYDGRLGGLAGADSKCQALANAAGLGGTYRAYLSATGLHAYSRFTGASGWTRVDGQPMIY
ncbi:MAG: InlB B-repeat-containing protein, partial [Myxococcales bacterium]|nr:InlB B-repeat-containing protein [Myxococcales bacterium]